MPCGIELLDAIIAPISHVHVADLITGEAPGKVQLSRPLATLPPGAEKGAVSGVFLDAVVTTVHHQQVVFVIKGQTSRPVKLTVTTALPAPPGEEGALCIEDGNALQGFIGDIDVLLSIERYGHGPHDLAISGAATAKIAVILFGQRA